MAIVPMAWPARFAAALFGGAVSVAAHASLVVVALVWVALHSLDRPAGPPPGAFSLDRRGAAAERTPANVLPDGTVLVEREPDPVGDVPEIHGGAAVPRMDTGSAGRGGEAAASTPALNLSDGDEGMRLSPDLVSRLDRDQIQRLNVARTRQSWEDRRSSLDPMELTFVAMGGGPVMQRRPDAPALPSRGAAMAPRASTSGGALGSTGDRGAGEAEASPRGGDRLGSAARSPGLGVQDGRPGTDHRTSAPVARARPDVVKGPVSVPANARAKPQDDVDSEQEVATTVRSLVHASTAGGLAGQGRGGTSGGGDPGAGGAQGEGSTSRALGPGDGNVFDINTRDPRLVGYFRQIYGKIHPLWVNAFPKSAALELKQGTVILEFTVHADGSADVAWPPVRPSGIEEFDRNCADAIRRAAPFAPIPRELGRGALRIRAPFVAINPVVR